MRSVTLIPELRLLDDKVKACAKEMDRNLPELRFFVLDTHEFRCLLAKRVYPMSPLNIWEGKDVMSKRYRSEQGQESSIYYEVVQTGNPSYAYLNDTNSLMMQASVMAHVVGHCEFSELNVMHDSNPDRTETVMFLTQQVERCRQRMGARTYQSYWNACESLVPLLAPNSQHNLARSVETESAPRQTGVEPDEEAESVLKLPYSSTLDLLLNADSASEERPAQRLARKQEQREALSREGYRLAAPCQDIAGFLREYAPASSAERNILDYFCTVNATHDFVARTQIMNEGWAMYWEKKIMLELFKERAVTGVIDYARVFSGVCYPRPFFQRNPYHLGYHMWNHIEQLYRDGKVSLDYIQETDAATKRDWKRQGTDPIAAMEHLVSTVTDYEFLRRFLSHELIEEFHLNRIPHRYARALGLDDEDIHHADDHWIWLHPEPVKEQMLEFFTHMGRPRIYLIDSDYRERGLLLYHRNDGRALRQDWIKPTLANLNLVWKGPVYLLSGDALYGYASGSYSHRSTEMPSFAEVCEAMQRGEAPFTISN
jgi:stage V sporulation protein R